MKKYKISKSNLKEFFGWFTKEKKPDKLQDIIDSDPVLKKLEAEIRALNDKAKPRLDAFKEKDPTGYKILQKYGLAP
jgi:hypothetical protein